MYMAVLHVCAFPQFSTTRNRDMGGEAVVWRGVCFVTRQKSM